MSQTHSLATSLDSLYRDYNREESASDPVHRVRPFADPRDREVAGFCAAALAFGRVASVLNTIDTLLAIMGPRPAEYVRQFDPAASHPELRAMVHRWTRGVDIAALLWVLRQMLEASGSIEEFFLAGDDPAAPDVAAALDGFSTRALALDVRRAYGRRAETSRCVLFLSAAVGWQRLQAPESVPALDGAARRNRPRRVDAPLAGAPHRAARHARHPPRTLPAPDALRQPRLEDGRRHHGVTADA